MLRNLFLFLMVFVSGCVWRVDSPHSHPHTDGSEHTESWEVLLSGPYIECAYDAYWDLSEWYFEIYADSYHGEAEVASVGFYINNYDFTSMDYVGGGLWRDAFTSNYYDCDRSLHFDFVGTDYDGYEGYYT